MRHLKETEIFKNKCSSLSCKQQHRLLLCIWFRVQELDYRSINDSCGTLANCYNFISCSNTKRFCDKEYIVR